MGERSGAPSGFSPASIVISKPPVAVQLPQPDVSANRDAPQAFERFVDFVMDRLKVYPDLHIYHFAPYEPAALKRLMGRYATREDELDQLLRGKRFVDLFAVVRQGLRAGVESYSIK